jgi:hypothetical protein
MLGCAIFARKCCKTTTAQPISPYPTTMASTALVAQIAVDRAEAKLRGVAAAAYAAKEYVRAAEAENNYKVPHDS